MKSKHPTQGAVPPIDRSAETLAPVEDTAGLAPIVENEPPYVFKQAGGFQTLDMIEIAMMNWIKLTGSQVEVEPGALRNIVLAAERFHQLSPQAQRHFQQVQPQVTVAEPAPAPAPSN